MKFKNFILFLILYCLISSVGYSEDYGVIPVEQDLPEVDNPYDIGNCDAPESKELKEKDSVS